MPTDVIKITFKNGKPYFRTKEVVLTDAQFRLLKGQGDRGSIHIRKNMLNFKSNEDRKNRENNQ